MNISIREASIGDYDDISRLHRQIHELHVVNRPDLYQSAKTTLDLRYFKAMLNDDAYKVFVAGDCPIVAYTIVKVEDAPHRPILIPRRIVYMNDVCVDKNSRGRGIGKVMFEKVKDYAKSVGAVSLELNVLAFNQDAIDFYTALNMVAKSIRLELDIE